VLEPLDPQDGRQYTTKRLILRGFLLIGERARTRKNGAGKANGAQGRNRIFAYLIEITSSFE
jgi:hypothetical protein